MLIAALLKHDYIAMIVIALGSFSIASPTLVGLDACTWKTMFKAWGLFILTFIIWIWAMQVGIVADAIQPE